MPIKYFQIVNGKRQIKQCIVNVVILCENITSLKSLEKLKTF